jgi:hypothetical protein
MPRQNSEHICSSQAICFQCFRAGVERTRARREAWAQRSLPFDSPSTELSPREIAHRRKMLEHLALSAQHARSLAVEA